MGWMTGLGGLSRKRLPFGSPLLGATVASGGTPAREAIASAADHRDDTVRILKRAQGLAQAVLRNEENLAALLGLAKARQAVAEARASVARARGEYEKASVELNAARVSAGLTRLEI